MMDYIRDPYEPTLEEWRYLNRLMTDYKAWKEGLMKEEEDVKEDRGYKKDDL